MVITRIKGSVKAQLHIAKGRGAGGTYIMRTEVQDTATKEHRIVGTPDFRPIAVHGEDSLSLVRFFRAIAASSVQIGAASP